MLSVALLVTIIYAVKIGGNYMSTEQQTSDHQQPHQSIQGQVLV